MKKVKKFICGNILGHKVDITKTDCNKLYCLRCNAHQYYDTDFDTFALFLIPFYIKRYIKKIISDYKFSKDKDNNLPF